MTTFRSEDGLVGLVALGVIPWIAWTLHRGLRDERLPIVRRHVRRAEHPGLFMLLFGAYCLAALLMGVIALDLLFGVQIWIWS